MCHRFRALNCPPINRTIRDEEQFIHSSPNHYRLLIGMTMFQPSKLSGLLDSGDGRCVVTYCDQRGDLLEATSRASGAEIVFRLSSEGGRLMPNGSWTGLMKDLVDGQVDFTLTRMILNRERLSGTGLVSSIPF